MTHSMISWGWTNLPMWPIPPKKTYLLARNAICSVSFEWHLWCIALTSFHQKKHVFHLARRWLPPLCLLYLTKEIWCGARLGGSKSNAVNLISRLFLYHFLHMMSSWCHESIHNNTNNQQTPPLWWWSRLPLQRRGFNESTTSEWWAALLMFVPRPLSKGFGRINKLK